MYRKEDLNPVDASEHVRRNPQLYLPNGKLDAIAMAGEVAVAALILGANRAQILRQGSWMVVSADKNWMCSDQESPFEKLLPFPQAGDNSCRPEFIITVFAIDVLLKERHGEPVVIKYSNRDSHEGPLFDDTQWDLSIAFRLLEAESRVH